MKKLLQRTTYILLLLPFYSFSQQIHIGQNAEEVNRIVRSIVQNNEETPGVHQVVMQYEPQYNNGVLDGIIQCKQYKLRERADFCTNYFFRNNKLEYIDVEYSNTISIQELLKYMPPMIKVGDYYFDIYSENYFWYHFAKDGSVSEVERNMSMNPPPANILKQLKSIKLQAKLQAKLEVEQQEKDHYKHAKLMYDELMNSYTNLGMVVNSDRENLNAILPYFQTLKIDPYLKINDNIKITYQKDSLLNFLPKYFHNEMIYFTISKNGKLLSISNKTDSLALTTEQYPFLKKWIEITGQVTLDYNNKNYPINYKYPALSLNNNESCPITTKYCFSVEGKDIGFIKDTSLIRNINKEYPEFIKYTGINEVCPVIIKYTFNKKEVESLLYKYANIKNIKELRRIKGNPFKPKVMYSPLLGQRC